MLHWFIPPLLGQPLILFTFPLLLFSHQVVSDSLWPRGLQHTRLPCLLPSPGVCWNSCPLRQWCHPTISSSVALFSFAQSIPASGSFPVSWLFTSGGQSLVLILLCFLECCMVGIRQCVASSGQLLSLGNVYLSSSNIFSRRGSSFPLDKWWQLKLLSCVHLCATPWSVAYQAPPSMGLSRQEYWSGLPFPPPGDLPDPGIEPRSPALQADTLLSEPPGKLSFPFSAE